LPPRCPAQARPVLRQAQHEEGGDRLPRGGGQVLGPGGREAGEGQARRDEEEVKIRATTRGRGAMPCRWAAWCVLGLFLLAGCQRAGEPEAAPTPEVEARTETRERQPFTLLATGDNRGQIAPCGCEPPVGGLSRRVVYVRKRREEGPLLVVDAGDALAEDGRADPERARLILRAMAATGIEAAAVGELDLALGVAWLRE